MAFQSSFTDRLDFILDGLTVVDVPEVQQGVACAICQDQALPHEFVSLQPCLHIFGRPCIEEWIGRANTCPMCRVELFISPSLLDQIEYVQARIESMQDLVDASRARLDAEEPNELEDMDNLTLRWAQLLRDLLACTIERQRLLIWLRECELDLAAVEGVQTQVFEQLEGGTMTVGQSQATLNEAYWDNYVTVEARVSAQRELIAANDQELGRIEQDRHLLGFQIAELNMPMGLPEFTF